MKTTVRAFMLGLGLLSLQIAGHSQQVAKSIPNSTSPDGLIGFLEFKPSDYGTQKHPLIIFLHGLGERGNGVSQVYNVAANGIPLLCSKGATMRFTVGGQTSSFVVLSPQLTSAYPYWPTFYVKEMIKYAKANLQIDPNRIYITGLSLGGGGIWRAITETENGDYSFDAGIAAAAPVCGTQEELDASFCGTIGGNHLPVWAFHSMDDGSVSVYATQHAEALFNYCGVTPAPKLTYYQSGNHSGAWVNAYDTGHITRVVSGGGSFTASPNLYEWFLTNTRGATPSLIAAPVAPTYTAPAADAGSAQTIALPTSVVTLLGAGTAASGSLINSYSWTQTDGPSTATIVSPLLGISLVTGLQQGRYVFVLTVTDNHGLTDSKSVVITVNAPPSYAAPTATVGATQSITLPVNSTTLSGGGISAAGATISSYSWAQTDGPSSATIANSKSPVASVTNLIQGRYAFVLTVTDNYGLTDSKVVFVFVNAPAAYTAPVATPSGAQTITLPANSVILWGAGSGTNGAVIMSYSWTQTDGPSTAAIAAPKGIITTVNNLIQGRYTFVLTITDNHGLTDSKAVAITVNPAAAYTAPVAVPSKAQTITLPANSVILWGAGSGSNGAVIMSYSWAQTSGPSTANIVSPGNIITGVNNLIQGVYTFVLTVTDNHGLTDSKAVFITVNAAYNANARMAGTAEQSSATLKSFSDTLATALPVVLPAKLTMYPNPVHTTATLELYSADNSDKTVTVYYSNGVLKARYTWHTIQGNNTFSLKDVAGLANGLYIIDITDGNGKPVGKLKFIKL